ncbi:hypothetical protein N9P28_02985 [Schleiferiaceae bacterium]|nr:hypothetical protein [Schleiferiaceae bacterium]
MSLRGTLTFDEWRSLIDGKGSFEDYQTYVKEQELKGTDSRGVDLLTDREVQNQLLILASKNSKRLNNISNISTFFLVLTIISIVLTGIFLEEIISSR